MTINAMLLVALVVAALATVMTARLLRSVIGLALTSVIVAILMYRLNAPTAAAFELSVCAGLIPAIFVSAIGLTQRLTPQTLAARRTEKMKTYWILPLLVVVAGLVLTRLPIPVETPPPPQLSTVRQMLWTLRPLDVLGQIVILLGGAFGVVVLLKEFKHD
jgi:NADH:ubiquinone oxidoreductase subunit 6 (subunit J)